MIEDPRDIPSGTELRTDVCIVGAGAAGITIARELIGRRLDVCLLESGGLEPDEAAQALASGESVGEPYFPLDANRARVVGGSTNLWAGWCRPLDALDLAPRDWLPLSGWPFDRAHLDPYYRRAQPICGIGPYEYDVRAWERRLGHSRIPLPADEVETKVFQLSPPTRFGLAYGGELRAAPNVRLVTGATATAIESAGDARSVTGVRAATLSGSRFTVSSRVTVLAAGGIENARLLLLSTDLHPAGLGNEHDLVGRYFMEHPHFVASTLTCNAPLDASLYSEGGAAVGRLFLPAAVQAREELLNYCAMPYPAAPRSVLERLRARLRRGRGWRAFHLFHTFEQAPRADSRVELGSERDPLGLPRARLHWRTGELERRTFERSQELIAESFERAGFGQLRQERLGPAGAWPPGQGDIGHHMGTTRMHPDPRCGVVDADCRVHGVHNLYIAGSSVFPTAGAGAPTLTIVALALRLADRLRAITGG